MSLPARYALVVTAEHGGNSVPREHEDLFRAHGELLASHRGWDPGTLALARRLSARLGAPLVEATVTRLLVDLNRSAHNPRVFSEVTRGLRRAEREELIDRYHTPHREAVTALVAGMVDAGQTVIHLGVHSFTPVLNGVVRRPDLALLYDPSRSPERDLSRAWAAALTAHRPTCPIGRNDPYRGTADGLTTTLRRRFPQERYVGIELEVNQRLLGRDGRFPGWVEGALLDTLSENGVGEVSRSA